VARLAPLVWRGGSRAAASRLPWRICLLLDPLPRCVPAPADSPAEPAPRDRRGQPFSQNPIAAGSLAAKPLMRQPQSSLRLRILTMQSSTSRYGDVPTPPAGPLAGQAGVTGGRWCADGRWPGTGRRGDQERPGQAGGAQAAGSRVPSMAARAASVRRRLLLRAYARSRERASARSMLARSAR